MPSPRITDAHVKQLVALIAAYIAEQRTAFRRKARCIGPDHRDIMAPYFPPDVLDNVRVARGNISEPDFYAELPKLGLHNAPRFSSMAGITFLDVVVHVEPLTNSLLFHELVHVTHYKHLGLQRFSELYVSGFLRGGSYEEIPLEKQAYMLEAQFAAEPKKRFSVEEDVLRKIRKDQF